MAAGPCSASAAPVHDVVPCRVCGGFSHALVAWYSLVGIRILFGGEHGVVSCVRPSPAGGLSSPRVCVRAGWDRGAVGAGGFRGAGGCGTAATCVVRHRAGSEQWSASAVRFCTPCRAQWVNPICDSLP